MQKVAPYGSWSSPITADLITQSSIRLGEVRVDKTGDGSLYWIEVRPEEQGRYAIVRRAPNGEVHDVLPKDFSARTRVHEYGGASYMIHEGVVYFVNFADQQIWRIAPGGKPEQLTHSPGLRFADMEMDLPRGLVAVCEDHTTETVRNTLVEISLEDGAVFTIASGRDFYSSPRRGPKGHLAHVAWNHPNMPWDSTLLFGSLGHLIEAHSSLVEPKWGPDGNLYYISDLTGYWNIYCWDGEQSRPVHTMNAEFTRPQWVLGMSHYGFTEDGKSIVAAFTKDGTWKLGLIYLVQTGGDAMQVFNLPYTDISDVHVHGNYVYFLGGSPSEPMSLVRMDLTTRKVEVIKRSSSIVLVPGYVSMPEAVEFPTEGGLTAFALFYPPTNKDFVGTDGEKPPLLVISHGGPTAATSSSMNLDIQYWASRGFAVLDVNYGGSTGYGTEYRNRLREKWGVVDVDDCVNGALYLVDQGRVARERLCIRGRSAGGYTTLATLTFCDVFKAGASHFGVSDLEALALHTHKFESRYLDGLIGPYPGRKDLYKARSPIHHVEGLSSPVIFFQGLEDRVVPPPQAQRMFGALVAKGVPTALVLFEGEQHGFRGKKAIIESLEGELYFYGEVLGFTPADPIAPITIENL